MTPSISPGARRRAQVLISRIPGYSQLAHWCFFEWLLRNHSIKDMLVLGVYHGRDIAFLLDILKWEHPTRKVKITGVDLFSDGPCADWPEEKRKLTWEQAGMGKPPSYNAAVANCPGATIVKMDDAEFLTTTKERWDCIYCDTDHTANTVYRQLLQARRLCRKGAILCGDDYRDGGTWGVRTAVTKSFVSHSVFADYIWHAKVECLRPESDIKAVMGTAI